MSGMGDKAAVRFSVPPPLFDRYLDLFDLRGEREGRLVVGRHRLTRIQADPERVDAEAAGNCRVQFLPRELLTVSRQRDGGRSAWRVAAFVGEIHLDGRGPVDRVRALQRRVIVEIVVVEHWDAAL